MRVELSGLIEGDLDAIAAYIAKDNPMRAVSSSARYARNSVRSD
jgi:plasmid stabilization system protein ParE